MLDRFHILLIAAVTAASRPTTVSAQGLAGASIDGRVLDAARAPIAHARVILTNGSTGNLWRAVTNDRGAYLFADVPVGGPYVIDVAAIGFQPLRAQDIVLHLGDHLTRDLALNQSRPTRLEGVVVHGSDLRDPGSGGPAHTIPGEVARNLPLLDRDFVGLFALSPLATGAAPFSLGGQHQRFNAIQVDGGSAGDFFGVNATPGSSTGARSLPLDAIDEIRIVAAPFDVRQGGFSGGLINAVTKSGTNQLRTSSFASFAGSDLVGRDTAGSAAQRFTSAQYGGSIAGPIVRNRLHYVAVGEVQVQHAPAVSRVDVSDSVARRIAEITRDVYGFDPGGPERPDLEQPNWNLFTKLSWQISDHHVLDVSLNALGARADVLGRTITDRPRRDGWALSNSGAVQRSAATTLRARLTTAFGPLTNEIVASYGTVHDSQQSRLRTPLFLVLAGDAGYVAAGSVKGAEDTRTDQRVLELSDNLSWSAGSHLFTLGTQDQLLNVHDNIFIESWGAWAFPSVEAFEQRQPWHYQVALPMQASGPLADYSPALLAAFVQDRWAITSRASITAGFRFDVPYFPRPQRNDSLAASELLGHIDTGDLPLGNGVVSPRLGFTYGFGPRESWAVRGGVGAFTGRLPLVWPTNAYSGTGTKQKLLDCDGSSGVPPPVTDIGELPSRCVSSAGQSAVPTITIVARGLRPQEAIKFDVGLDHDLGRGFVASVDLLHTRTRNTLTLDDLNLVPMGKSAEGREMYGAIGTDGLMRPARRDARYGPVYRFENRTGDRATSVSVDLQREWTSGAFLQLGYQWLRADDLMSLTGLSSPLLFQNNPIDGTIANRRLRRSARDVPHNFVAAAVVPLPSKTTAAVFFRAHSGTPYAYVVSGPTLASGDANADGTASNDLSYVPRDAADITLTDSSAYRQLDAFIESQPCLRTQRGRIMARNTCRNPSVRMLDGRVSKRLGAAEISVDVFNLPNLLNRDWGLVRATTDRETAPLMSVAGYDATANRPRYLLNLPPRNGIVSESSRWRIQLGARVATPK